MRFPSSILYLGYTFSSHVTWMRLLHSMRFASYRQVGAALVAARFIAPDGRAPASRSRRRNIFPRKRQSKAECGTHSQFAFDPHRSPMSFNDLVGNIEAYSQSR